LSLVVSLSQSYDRAGIRCDSAAAQFTLRHVHARWRFRRTERSRIEMAPATRAGDLVYGRAAVRDAIAGMNARRGLAA